MGNPCLMCSKTRVGNRSIGLLQTDALPPIAANFKRLKADSAVEKGHAAWHSL